MSVFRFLPYILFLLIIASCKSGKVASSKPSATKPSATGPSQKTSGKVKNETVVILVDQVQQKMQSMLLSASSEQHGPVFTSVYKQHNYAPFWLDSVRCKQAINVLKDSYYDGLFPEDYKVKSLDSLYTLIFTGKDTTLNAQVALECLVSKQMIRYMKHMWIGRTDPQSIFPEWQYEPRQMPAASDTLIFQNFTGKVDSIPGHVRPHTDLYNSLRHIMYSLDTIRSEEHWQHIPTPKKALQSGDTSYIIPMVKKQLHRIGMYSSDVFTNEFDADLVSGVKLFQKHVAITPSGKLDKLTISRMNFSVSDIRAAARVNMERCRWMMHDLPDEYIFVNIAAFTLQVIDHKKVVYQCNVVVGANNHQTPVFKSNLSNIEFNPYWSVPRSIAVNEILPHLKKDPTYLSRNNMELMMGAEPVDISTIDVNALSDNYFPYTIRQKPGTSNALGLVKFNFPNPYSVYMHDTPSRSLFNEDVRNFSHGCIRVQNPLTLAAFLLKDQHYTQEKVNALMLSNENTVLSVSPRMPIMIMYLTCYADQNGYLYFFKDIYGQDARIMSALMAH